MSDQNAHNAAAYPLDSLKEPGVDIRGIDYDPVSLIICDEVDIRKTFCGEMRHYPHHSPCLRYASSGFEYLNETFFVMDERKLVRLRLQSSIDVDTRRDSEKLL